MPDWVTSQSHSWEVASSLGLSPFAGYPTFLTFPIGCKLFGTTSLEGLTTVKGEGQTGRTRFVRSLCLLDYMLVELGGCLFVFHSFFFGRCSQRVLVRTGRTRKDKTRQQQQKKNALINSVDLVVHCPCSCYFCCYFAFRCRLEGIWRLAKVANANGVGRNISWWPKDGCCCRHYELKGNWEIAEYMFPSTTDRGSSPPSCSFSTIARYTQVVFTSTKERQGQKVFSLGWFVCAFLSLSLSLLADVHTMLSKQR